MARMRFRRSYNFDSATRQLDSRDLDDAGDPTTDMGAAMESLLLQYGALDLQPAYPGLDIMEGELSPGPIIADDFGDLAAGMARASGYEEWPATLPALGEWTSPSDSKIRWTPNNPGIYQWYAHIQVTLDAAADPASTIATRQPLPDILDETWGADLVPAAQLSDTEFLASSQGMLMASVEMMVAGYGGLNWFSPYYNLVNGEAVDSVYVLVAVMSWSPAGTVPYLSGI